MHRLMIATALLAGAAVAHSQDVATEVSVTEAAPGVYMLGGANGFSSSMALIVLGLAAAAPAARGHAPAAAGEAIISSKSPLRLSRHIKSLPPAVNLVN